ncbi:MAG: PQQ-like beta-propeller repeat protein [Planctomycetales bacterium]|nr:PQQ-like beta-propeller repeat protein [bacterium]UNM06985.1 MAG: PQQ-like beta-propeller repeat protein [Planctomycetales bacterium]
MRQNIPVILAVLAAVVLLAGCAGQAQPVNTGGSGDNLPLDTDSLPRLQELGRSGSAAGISADGSSYRTDLPIQSVSANGAKGTYSPSSSSPLLISDMAYALYELDLTGISPLPQVSLDWESAPASGSLWIALSEWGSNRWHFIMASDNALVSVPGILDYADENQRMFLGIFVSGSSPAVLNGMSIEQSGGDPVGPGDWFMFGRDERHQRRSPFTGPADNNVRWSYTATGPCVDSPSIAADGTVYFGSYDFSFYAVNPNGTLKWSFPTEGEVESSAAIADDGTIYFGSYDGSIYALDSDGNKKWEFITGAEVTASPVIATDGTIYCGSWDGTLYAINPNGTSKWTYFTGNDVSSSVALDNDGNLYFGTEGGGGFGDSFYSLKPNMELRWSYETGDAVVSSPSISEDGTIHVGCADHKLYAFNPNGTLKWSYTAGDEIVSTPAIDGSGNLYFGSADMKIYAVDKDGNFLWSYDADDVVTSSAALDAEGTLYIGSFDGIVRAIKSDGMLKWEYDTGEPVVSSPSIGPDGAIYVGSADNKLYCFGSAGG